MLPDCLTWILWDKTVRAAEKATLIRDGQDAGEGSIVFESEAGIFKVIRKRTLKKLNLKIQKYNGDKFVDIPTKLNTQAQNKINNILGFNYDNFVNVSYIGQNATNGFVNGKPKDRESIIANFFRLFTLDDAVEIAKKKYKIYKDDFTANNARIDTWREIINNVSYEELSERRTELYQKKLRNEEKLVKTNKLLETADYFINVLVTKEKRQLQYDSNLALKKQKIKSFEDGKEELRSDANRIKVLKVQQSRAAKARKRLTSIENKIKNLEDEFAELNHEVGRYSGRIVSIKQRLKEAMEILNFSKLKCPTCKQDLSDEHLVKINDQKNTFDKTLKSYMLSYEEAKLSIQDVEEEIEDYRAKSNSLRASINSKDHVDGEIDRIIKRRKRYKQSKEELKLFVKNIDKENAKLKSLIEEAEKENIPEGFNSGHIEKIRLRIIELEKRMERIAAETNKVKKQRKEYRAAERKVGELSERQSIISDSMAAYSYLIDVFKQVKLAFIDDINDELEKIINAKLREMGSRIRVELVTEATKKSDGVSIDRYDIIIHSAGKKRPWETYSGGEKQRISLAIYFAFNELIKSKFGIDVNILIFDEIFMSMDDVGRDIFLGMIRKMGKHKNVIIITHIEEIISEFPPNQRLYFIKDKNGISRIKKRN